MRKTNRSSKKWKNQFEMNKISLDSDCHNHFQEIQRQIDLHREKLIEKIDIIYMEMIDGTKECERSFMKSLNENQQTFVKSFKQPLSVEEDLEGLENTFRNPNLVLSEVCGKKSVWKDVVTSVLLIIILFI